MESAPKRSANFVRTYPRVSLLILVVVVAAVVLSWPSGDDRLYNCETGEVLDDVYQAGGRSEDRADVRFGVYHGDDSSEQVARSCSEQMQRAGARAVACSLIVEIDYGSDEGPIRDEWGEVAPFIGDGESTMAELHIGPSVFPAPGPGNDYDFLVDYGDGAGWQEARISDLSVGGHDGDVHEICVSP